MSPHVLPHVNKGSEYANGKDTCEGALRIVFGQPLGDRVDRHWASLTLWLLEQMKIFGKS